MTMHRRSFIAGATASAFGATILRASAETTVRIGVLPSIICAQAFVAQQMGYFKKHGLDVQLQTMNNGPSMAAAIAGGSLDVALSEPISLANARLRGLNFAYIAGGLETTPTFPENALLVRADSGITDGKSLQGKTIAVNAVNTISSVTPQWWVDQDGGDFRSLKFVEMPLPQMLQSVDAGTVTAAFAGEPVFTLGRERGMKVVIFKPGTPAATFMNSAWFGAEEWVGKNREVAIAIRSALREAATWANANRSAAASMMETTLKAPENSLRNLVVPPYFSDRPADPALFQPLLDAAARYGALGRPLRAEEIVAKL